MFWSLVRSVIWAAVEAGLWFMSRAYRKWLLPPGASVVAKATVGVTVFILGLMLGDVVNDYAERVIGSLAAAVKGGSALGRYAYEKGGLRAVLSRIFSFKDITALGKEGDVPC